MANDLELLKKIYNAFDPFRPLPAGDPVYVDCREVRGDGDILVELGREILLSDRRTCQIYGGHRGGGKSTELLRLKKYLEDNGCFVVYFAADEEDIDPEDAQYTDILLACTRHLLEELKNANPQPLLNWLQERWQSLRDLALTEIALESLSVEGQISQFAKITGNLRAVPKSVLTVYRFELRLCKGQLRKREIPIVILLTIINGKSWLRFLSLAEHAILIPIVVFYLTAVCALYQLGRYEEAIASYEQALELKPDYHYALLHSYVLLWRKHSVNLQQNKPLTL